MSELNNPFLTPFVYAILDTRYLKLDASNDPVTGQLNIEVPTATSSALVLKSTDDSATNPLLNLQSSASTSLSKFTSNGRLMIGNISYAASLVVANTGYDGTDFTTQADGTILTLKSTDGVSHRALTVIHQVAPTATQTTASNGFNAFAMLTTAQSLTSTAPGGLVSGRYIVETQTGSAGATITSAVNVAALFTGRSLATTVTNYYQFLAESGGTISNTSFTNRFSYYIQNPAASALLTNHYGFYSENISRGTNSYGLYLLGANTEVAHLETGQATAKGIVIRGAASQTANLFEIQNSSSTVITNFRDSVTGASETSNFLNITGTLPTVMTANTIGANFIITSAGSSSFSPIGLKVLLDAGYTGSSATIAMNFLNSTAGTNATYTGGNSGATWIVNGTTVGYNIGYKALAQGSSTLNIGGTNRSVVSTAGTNIGITGTALNGTTANIGGLFHLSAANTIPTLESAALIADNMATTSPIFLGRDNGTKVFTLADGGAITAIVTTASLIPLTIQGASSQSADLLVFENSSGTDLTSFDSSGHLGIGVTTATASLYVNTTSYSMIDWTTSTDAGIFLRKTTATTASRTFVTALEVAPSSNSSAIYQGLNSYSLLSTSVNLTKSTAQGGLTGGRYLVGMEGSGSNTANVTRAVSVSAVLDGNNSSGTVQNWIGYLAEAGTSLITTLTVTNRFGFYVETPAASSTLTNAYGLYVENQTTAGTLNYAIYTGLGDVRFGDDVLIASPTASVLTLGAGTAGIDYVLKFDGETNDGTITYMEDEDRFDFDNDLGVGGKVKVYNNIATEGYGVAAIVDNVELTAQTANITATNFSNAGTAGLYRINYYLLDTTADVTAGTLTVTIAWNDGTSAQTLTSASVNLATAGSFTQGVIYVRLGSGNVTYATTVTGIFGTAQYSLYMNAERLN